MARHKVSHIHAPFFTDAVLDLPEPGFQRYGTYRADSLFGGAGGDTLEGFGGSDMILGYGGDDYLTGDANNDTLFGGEGNDHLYSGSGRNQLFGDDGNDELNSYGSADRLHGGSGDDTLIAHDGNDTLWGGEGADSMFGGLGADVFQFKAANESGTTWATMDKIEDFEDGIDKIHLWAIDADANKTGNQAFRLSDTGAFDGEAGSLRVIARNGDTLIMADFNGDKVADFTIKLEGVHTLTVSDFIL